MLLRTYVYHVVICVVGHPHVDLIERSGTIFDRRNLFVAIVVNYRLCFTCLSGGVLHKHNWLTWSLISKNYRGMVDETLSFSGLVCRGE